MRSATTESTTTTAPDGHLAATQAGASDHHRLSHEPLVVVRHPTSLAGREVRAVSNPARGLVPADQPRSRSRAGCAAPSRLTETVALELLYSARSPSDYEARWDGLAALSWFPMTAAVARPVRSMSSAGSRPPACTAARFRTTGHGRSA